MTSDPTELLLFGVGCAVATSHVYLAALGFQVGRQGATVNRLFALLALCAAWTVFWLGALGTRFYLDVPRLRFFSQLLSGYVGPLIFLFCVGITRPQRGIPSLLKLAPLTGLVGTTLSVYALTHPVELADLVVEYETTGKLVGFPGVWRAMWMHTAQNLGWMLAGLGVLVAGWATSERQEVRSHAVWVLLAVFAGLVSILMVNIVPMVWHVRWIVPLGPVASIPTFLIIYRTLLSSRELMDRLQKEREAAELARQVAQAANQAKSAFLANMSHELRTPLNAVIGYSEMLAEDLEDDAPHALEDLERIRSSGAYLLALINDILDLSKVQAGRMELHVEPLALGPLFDEVARESLPLFDKHGSSLQVEPTELGVLGDPIRVRQILLNLLSNAAKFSAGEPVSLEAVLEEGTVRIAVRDRGIGMDDEQQARLFGAFEQVHREGHAEYGGTGLGLALSRELARGMQGDIVVESEPGQGSTFTLLLPVQPE